MKVARRAGVLLICASIAVLGRGAVLHALQADHPPWAGPAAIQISTERNEPRFVYNTTNVTSDDGAFVVWFRHVKDYPARLWVRDVATWTKRVIARPHQGYTWKREISSPGRYRSWGSKFLDLTPDAGKIVFSSPYRLVPQDRNHYSDVYMYDRAARTYLLISVGPDGRPGNSPSYGSSVSDDGRFVAFSTGSSDLVQGDTNRQSDVFVRDVQEGITIRASVANDGSQGTRTHRGEEDRYGSMASGGATISADGTRVAFLSDADNFVPGDDNAATDAFVRDLVAGTTTRVSVSSSGEQLQPYEYCESASCFRDGVYQAEISGDGDTVVFVTHANGLIPEDQNDNLDAYVHDLSTGITDRVSEPTGGGEAYPEENPEYPDECGDNGQCFFFIATTYPSISDDGNRVFFLSGAPEMTDEDDDELADEDVFVHDRLTGVTQLVNRKPDGSWAASANIYPGSISADGRWITYSSDGRGIAGPRVGNGDVYLQELDDASFSY